MTYTDIISSIYQQRSYMILKYKDKPTHIILGAKVFDVIGQNMFDNYFTAQMQDQTTEKYLLGMKIQIDYANPENIQMGYMEQVPVYKFKEEEE